MNETSGDRGPQVTEVTAIQIPVIVLCFIILLLGLVGNLVVIYIFGWCRRHKRRKHEFLLLLLAIGDLLGSGIVLPLIIHRTIVRAQASSSSAGLLCALSEVFISYTVTFSDVIIVILCIERYIAISSPLRGGIARREIYIALATGGAIMILVAAPIMGQELDICFSGGKPTLKTPLLVYAALCFVRDFLALTVMSALTVRSLAILKAAKLTKLSDTRQRRQKNLDKARKMLMVMIVCFALCTTPYTIYLFVTLLVVRYGNIDSRSQGMPLFVGITYLRTLVLLGTATNPVIYSTMHPDRKAFRKRASVVFYRVLITISNMFRNSPQSDNIDMQEIDPQGTRNRKSRTSSNEAGDEGT